MLIPSRRRKRSTAARPSSSPTSSSSTTRCVRCERDARLGVHVLTA
jgi:hypothetical protein